MIHRRGMLTILSTATALTLFLGACGQASDSIESDDDAGDTPVALGQCAEESPDCDDTLVLGDGGTPSAAGTCPEGTVDCNDTPGDVIGDPLPPNDDAPADEPVVGGGMTVEEALVHDRSDVVGVTGFFVEVDGEAKLCSAIAESYPPQCGGASLVISNPGDVPTDVPIVEEGTTRWLDSAITLYGRVADGQLVVE